MMNMKKTIRYTRCLLTASTALAIVPVAAQADIKDNLVVHLTFDGDYNDTSGNKINGTPVGSPQLVAGKIGTQAVSVTTLKDGSEFDYVTLGYPAQLKFGATSDFSVSFWCNITNQVDDPPFISNKDWIASNNKGWVIASQGGGNIRVNVTGETTAGKYNDTTTPNVRDGAWHNVVLSFGRSVSNAVIYVDGAVVSSAAYEPDGSIDTDDLTTASGQPFAVNIGQDGQGTYTDNGSAQMVGMLIDDMAIWSRRLTSNDVYTIFHNGLVGKSFDADSSQLPPVISMQPQGQTHYAGMSAKLVVEAGGAGLQYQWYKGDAKVDGATNSTLAFASLQTSQSGSYKAVVSNANGSVTSQAAVLTVLSLAKLGTISDQLSLHLAFERDYKDSSGNGADGTAVGSPLFVPGKIGSSAVSLTTLMDGSQMDYITLNYPPSLLFTTNDFTVSFWCNWTNSADDQAFLSNKNWDNSANRGWIISMQGGGNLRVNITGEGGTKQDTTSTPAIRDGKWHLVTVSVARQGSANTYVDGEFIVSNTMTLTTGSVDTDDLSYAVNIGQDGRGSYTDGSKVEVIDLRMDDVAIWRRALSSTEVEYIYVLGGLGLSFTENPPVPVTPPTLTAVKGSNGITISWDATAAGFTLESKASLSDASWSTVPGVTGNSTTISASGASGFYRLRK